MLPENSDNTSPQPSVQPSQTVEMSPTSQPPQTQDVIPNQSLPAIPPTASGSSKKRIIIFSFLVILVFVILLIVSFFMFNKKPVAPVKDQSVTTKDTIDKQDLGASYSFVAYKAVNSKSEKSKLITFNYDFSDKKEQDYGDATNKIEPPANHCVKYENKDKWICLDTYDGNADGSIKYTLYETDSQKNISNIDEATLAPPIIDQTTFKIMSYPESPPSFYRTSLEPVAIRNDSEIIFLSYYNGSVGTFDLISKKFKWIYKSSFDEKTAKAGSGQFQHVGYSKTQDKIFYISWVDPIFEIVEIDLETGIASKIESGKDKILEIVASKNGSKIAYKVVRPHVKEPDFSHNIDDVGYWNQLKLSEVEYWTYDLNTKLKNKSGSQAIERFNAINLLGITTNGDGLIVEESIDGGGDIIYLLKDDKKTKLLGDDCKITENNCYHYLLYQ